MKDLFQNYYDWLGSLDVDAIERGDPSGPTTPKTRLQHARWMCAKAQSIDDDLKLNRWLGFVQGFLVAENLFTIDQCIIHCNIKIQNELIERYKRELLKQEFRRRIEGSLSDEVEDQFALERANFLNEIPPWRWPELSGCMDDCVKIVESFFSGLSSGNACRFDPYLLDLAAEIEKVRSNMSNNDGWIERLAESIAKTPSDNRSGGSVLP